MKKITLISVIGLLAVAGFAIFAAFQMGEKSPIIAEGVVRVDEQLEVASRGIRTLFIIVHDEESHMPMPYGAIKVTLDDDAKGDFYHFKLTQDNLRVMNPSAPAPKSLLLKARLDLDGQGGRAQPGDLIGELTSVPFGKDDIVIQINSKVE